MSYHKMQYLNFSGQTSISSVVEKFRGLAFGDKAVQDSL